MRVRVPTRLPGAPTPTILNLQRLLKTLNELGGSVVTEDPGLQHAAEQLALVLSDHGLQRMTARVLATLLFTEQSSMTMGELAERLAASSGAISGAVKMLTSVGLAERVPVPASRRDHYRLRDDAWALLYTNQNAVLFPMLAAAEAGIAAAGRDSLAGHRLTEMRDFYAFLLGEIPALLDRWNESRGGISPTT
ncbi:MarR family transcriptional regulator [Mycolicibacterium sp. P9-64]|nr:MarR family transcriptional regulator [Mycolicibacterium sp. P9-64]